VPRERVRLDLINKARSIQVGEAWRVAERVDDTQAIRVQSHQRRHCVKCQSKRALSNLSTITGREGGLAPAAFDSQETIPALGVPII